MLTKNRDTFRPTLEGLEDRQLLAASASLLPGGVLRVTGTNAADTIVVRQVNNQISVDGARGAFPVSRVSRVEVNALGGDDRVFLNSEAVRGQQPLARPAVVWGGAGNDQVSGGAAGGQFQGNDGNDVIYGGNAADVIFGQAGDDKLYGLGGADRLYGGEGNDTLVGGLGADLLDGGLGTNQVRAGKGDQLAGLPSKADPRKGASWIDVGDGTPYVQVSLQQLSFGAPSLRIEDNAGRAVGQAFNGAILTVHWAWQDPQTGRLWFLVGWDQAANGTVGINPEAFGTQYGWVQNFGLYLLN